MGDSRPLSGSGLTPGPDTAGLPPPPLHHYHRCGASLFFENNSGMKGGAMCAERNGPLPLWSGRTLAEHTAATRSAACLQNLLKCSDAEEGNESDMIIIKNHNSKKKKRKKTQVWDAGKVRSEDLFLQIDSSLHSRVKFVGKHPHQRFPPSSYQGSAKFNSPISLHDWQQDRALTHTKRKKREREKKKRPALEWGSRRPVFGVKRANRPVWGGHAGLGNTQGRAGDSEPARGCSTEAGMWKLTLSPLGERHKARKGESKRSPGGKRDL